MTIIIDHPKLTDLAKIMEIERAGFSADEAASEAAMLARITSINDTFIVARNQWSEVVGYVVGPTYHQLFLTDELYEQIERNKATDRYQTVLSLAVDPNYRMQGIATKLLAELKEIAEKNRRQAISLTCLEPLIPYYQKQGYQNEGVSASSHANECWYNMVLYL